MGVSGSTNAQFNWKCAHFFSKSLALLKSFFPFPICKSVLRHHSSILNEWTVMDFFTSLQKKEFMSFGNGGAFLGNKLLKQLPFFRRLAIGQWSFHAGFQQSAASRCGRVLRSVFLWNLDFLQGHWHIGCRHIERIQHILARWFTGASCSTNCFIIGQLALSSGKHWPSLRCRWNHRQSASGLQQQFHFYCVLLERCRMQKSAKATKCQSHFFLYSHERLEHFNTSLSV